MQLELSRKTGIVPFLWIIFPGEKTDQMVKKVQYYREFSLHTMRFQPEFR